MQRSHASQADPNSGQSPVIAVRGLTHRYSGTAKPAVEGVDFEVPHGALAGLIGPNGAGKSTLIGVLTGVLRVQQGLVRVGGKAPRYGRAVRAATSLVPQACAFYSAMTGRENLRFVAGVHGLSHEAYRRNAAHAIEVARLEGVVDRPAAQYSGGLQRRLNLALGLINRPEILYLDEPTVGVDAVSRRYIVDAIGHLRAQGTTIVYTSHYMEEIEDLCDQVTVIDHGRTVASGATDALLARWGGASMTVRLRAPLSPEAAAPLRPWLQSGHGERTLYLSATCTDELNTIIRILAAGGAEIDQLYFGVERLADVYWRLLQVGNEP